MIEKGYLYIANGASYIREAVLSAISLRKCDKFAHISLITNSDELLPIFDRVYVFKEGCSNWHQALEYKVKHIYASSPYKKTVYIDTDTFFYSACREVFDLLEYSDLYITAAPRDNHSITIEKHKFKDFHSYNTGFIAYRKNIQNKKLFRIWLENYKIKLNTKFLKRETDQTSFMKAVLVAKSKIFVLPNKYNARIPYFISLTGLVKMVHGRNSDYIDLEKKINIVSSNRNWDPVRGVCIFRHQEEC